jgi:hypothetical protein
MSNTAVSDQYRAEHHAPSTPQAIRNGLNVITKNAAADILTVDFDSITKNARVMVDRVDAENRAKAGSSDDGWRNELDELNRRLTGQLTVEEAKQWVGQQEQLHRDAVKAVQDELTFAEALLVTPGLSRCRNRRDGKTPLEGDTCDTCVFSRRVQAVVYKLTQAKAAQQQSIRRCGTVIAASKDLEQYRPRWAELKKREVTIANARRNIREHKSTRQQQPKGSSWISPGGMEIEG